MVYRQWQIFAGPEVASLVVCRDRNTEKLLTAFTETTVVAEWGAGARLATSGAIQGYWYSPKNDFGLAHACKTITELHFSAHGDGAIQITVFADEKEQVRTVTLSAEEKHYKLPFALKGHLIGFLVKIQRAVIFRFRLLPLSILPKEILFLRRTYAKIADQFKSERRLRWIENSAALSTVKSTVLAQLPPAAVRRL